LAEEQSLKFSITVVNKTAASTVHFASCLFTYKFSAQLHENKFLVIH